MQLLIRLSLRQADSPVGKAGERRRAGGIVSEGVNYRPAQGGRLTPDNGGNMDGSAAMEGGYTEMWLWRCGFWLF